MYLALARKYRPQKFADLIGQPHITRTLQNALQLDKLYPTLIFSGMKGVGKTSAARILSKTLNCQKGPSIEPCNECPICKEITEDKSPDYIEIDGASNNGVEEIRNLKEKVKYKPIKNKYRVIVIDEVHMLSNSAWNALLKTIEEPPEYTYFVMATTDFHKIPATIVSRCQHFEFKRIPYEVIIKLLKEICNKEKIKIADYSLYLIARSADGSLRDAKKILDQAIAISSGDVNEKDVIDILGIIEEDLFIKLTQYILNQDRKAIIKQINELSERGMDLRFFYSEYLKFLRNLMVLKSLGDSEQLHDLNPENTPRLNEMLKNVRDIELLRYFNAAKDMEMTIKNTENPRIILEYLFLKLTYFSSLVSIEEYIDKVKNGDFPQVSSQKEKKNNLRTKENIDSQLTSVSSGTIETNLHSNLTPPPSEGQLIKSLVDKIGKEKPRLVSAIQSSSCEFSDNTLTVKFSLDLDYAFKIVKDHTDYLEEKVSDLYKNSVRVNVLIDDKKDINNEASRKKELESDENVNRLADKIKGRIISIEKMSR